MKTLMLNALQMIQSNPTAKIFRIGDLQFAQFQCPAEDEDVGIWAQHDLLLHVVSGSTKWKLSTVTYSANAGETLFFKKGAYILPPHFQEEEVCVEIFFLPNSFVRETVMELAPDLAPISSRVDLQERAIKVNDDVALSAFFQAMAVYFGSSETPPEALMKLKLKELLISVLTGEKNQLLSAYLRSIAASNFPDICAIMETNFYHNLSLEAFAEICHRSVSSFKRAFQKEYGTSPGRWLLDRRLRYAASLIQTTPFSITEIAFECGFEDVSHFSRAFKQKFGRSPRLYREAIFVPA